MKRRLTLLSSMLMLFAGLMMSVPASADTLVLTLSNPIQNAAPGSTLDFVATASAPSTNGGAVSLASDSITADFPLSVDDTGFFNNFPLTLDPGTSFTGLLFTVTLPSDAAQGSYFGTFSIQDDDGAILDTATFQVSAVPEPGTITLLATGVSGLFVAVRRKRRIEA